MNKEIMNLFNQLALKLNMPTSAEHIRGKGYANEFLKMDFNSIYGGYRLDVVEKSTGERFFDGSSRMSKSEMISYLRGLLKGLEV